MSEPTDQIDYIIRGLKDFQSSSKLARTRADTALASEGEGNARIRAWLLAANAGALLISFNAMLGGEICDWGVFRPLVLLFVVGLASAFFSFVADRRSHSIYRILMVGVEKLANNLAKQATEFETARPFVVEGDSASAIERLKPVAATFDELNARSKQLDKIDTGFWHSAAGWLELLSVAALACGLVWAVSDSTFIQALCASAPSVATPSEQELPVPTPTP